MIGLELSPRLDDPDGLFETLVEAHRDLDPAASRRLDARVIFILANHIGSTGIVQEAIRIAIEAGDPPEA
jgi:hypothetical protein